VGCETGKKARVENEVAGTCSLERADAVFTLRADSDHLGVALLACSGQQLLLVGRQRFNRLQIGFAGDQHYRFAGKQRRELFEQLQLLCACVAARLAQVHKEQHRTFEVGQRTNGLQLQRWATLYVPTQIQYNAKSYEQNSRLLALCTLILSGAVSSPGASITCAHTTQPSALKAVDHSQHTGKGLAVAVACYRPAI
jgi:hypothetical protein